MAAPYHRVVHAQRTTPANDVTINGHRRSFGGFLGVVKGAPEIMDGRVTLHASAGSISAAENSPLGKTLSASEDRDYIDVRLLPNDGFVVTQKTAGGELIETVGLPHHDPQTRRTTINSNQR